MVKLNDYLAGFLVLDGVTARKISCEEFFDALEDRILDQWKLEFKKEGIDLSFSMLKEFLDVCVRLEEAELQKPLVKKIACARKEAWQQWERKTSRQAQITSQEMSQFGKTLPGKTKEKVL
eukprot:420676-Ditylum_brightwellii.AAC.1